MPYLLRWQGRLAGKYLYLLRKHLPLRHVRTRKFQTLRAGVFRQFPQLGVVVGSFAAITSGLRRACRAVVVAELALREIRFRLP